MQLKEETRPWGKYKVIYRGDRFLIKILEINPKSKTSLQYHNFREEYWIILEGKGEIIKGKSLKKVKEGDFIKINKKEVHRIINNGDKVLKILEVWVGEKLCEDDIVRLEDDYGRA